MVLIDMTWTNEIVNKLKQHTDREIRVRFKYIDNAEWYSKLKKPLHEDLKDAWEYIRTTLNVCRSSC